MRVSSSQVRVSMPRALQLLTTEYMIALGSLNCVKLYFGVVLVPSIFQNDSTKLSIPSKNSKQKMLSGYDPEPVRE